LPMPPAMSMDAPAMYSALNVLGLADMQADQMREEQRRQQASSHARECCTSTSRPLVMVSSWSSKIFTKRPHPWAPLLPYSDHRIPELPIGIDHRDTIFVPEPFFNRRRQEPLLAVQSSAGESTSSRPGRAGWNRQDHWPGRAAGPPATRSLAGVISLYEDASGGLSAEPPDLSCR
jgi:hypothetical protein